MGDQHIEAQTTAQTGAPDVHKNLLADTTFHSNPANTDKNDQLTGVLSTSGGRVGMGLVEGFGNSFSAAAKDVRFELDHPTMLGKQLLSGAAVGALMRVALPEEGALTAAAGTLMSYFFLKDAAKPIIDGVGQAANAKTKTEFDSATKTMGDGLGSFYVQGGISMVGGALGTKAAGFGLRNTEIGRSLETWKGRQFNSDQTATGRFFLGAAAKADNFTDSISAKLLGKQPEEHVPLGEKLDSISKVGKKGASHGGNPDAAGESKLPGANDKIPTDVGSQSYKQYNFEDMISEGRRFRDMGDKIDALLGEQSATAEGTKDLSAASISAKRSLLPEENSGKTADATAKPTDAPNATPAESGDLTSDKVGSMAVAMRTATSKVSKDDMTIAQVKEDFAGPLVSTMRPVHPGDSSPLDPGHYPNSKKLLALDKQIETPQDVQQAGPLLDHFRVALQQLEISTTGEMPQIKALNQFSRSVHIGLMGRLIKAGVPLEALRGTNSPMFGIRDVDGAGPYTIPAIPKATDAAVVSYPREFDGLQGVHTSGVYPHELGHDLVYGDLLRFPAEQRNKIITESVVQAAMKKAGIEDTEIQVPGSPNGTMKKSDYYVSLLKAEANENTADMFGTSVDPNTPLSLAVLLGALRKPPAENPTGPGQLETRSMYGKDMVDPEMQNTIGIEPHGIDRWRLKLGAQTLRELSNGDKGVNDYANWIDGLANSMARPGSQYVWANTDEAGKFVSIPQNEWDAIIPDLVKAQFNTPLDVLKGKTMKDVSPNMPEVFGRMDKLSSMMADAAVKGHNTITGFDKGQYNIEDVYSAGLYGWAKAVSAAKDQNLGITPDALMQRINKLSADMTSQYADDMPEKAIPGWTGPTIGDVATKPFSAIANLTGKAAELQPHLRNRFSTGATTLGAYAGVSVLGPELLQYKQLQDQMKHISDSNP